MRKVNFLKLFDLRFKADFFILYPCERNVECGVRNAERPHSANATLTRKKLIDYICIYPTFLDFEIWMQYATKVKQQRGAVLWYCALKGFCL